MLTPVDPEVFAQVRADYRARRGPFRHDVVMPHELVSHYGVNRIKKTQAAWVLRQIGSRVVVVNREGIRTTLFLVDPTLDLRPMQTRELYLRERGLS